jgi:hypothetical protein
VQNTERRSTACCASKKRREVRSAQPNSRRGARPKAVTRDVANPHNPSAGAGIWGASLLRAALISCCHCYCYSVVDMPSTTLPRLTRVEYSHTA